MGTAGIPGLHQARGLARELRDRKAEAEAWRLTPG